VLCDFSKSENWALGEMGAVSDLSSRDVPKQILKSEIAKVQKRQNFGERRKAKWHTPVRQ